MIGEKDIQNVRNIIEKTKQFEMLTEKDKKRFEALLAEFDATAIRYLKEVKNNDRLQQYH